MDGKAADQKGSDLEPANGFPRLNALAALCVAAALAVFSYMFLAEGVSARVMMKQFSKRSWTGGVDMEAAQATTSKREAPANASIYWLHLSKSSGTWFCKCGMEVAGRNALHAFDTAKNCHYLDENKPTWGSTESSHELIPPRNWEHPRHHSRSCLRLAHAMADESSDFEGNENWLPSFPGMRSTSRSKMVFSDPRQQVRLCSQFRNIILLREPVKRAKSLAFEMYKHAKSQHILPKNAIFEDYARRVMRDELISMDNLAVRALGGRAVFFEPFGEIKQFHLDQASMVLRSFDDVLISDASPAGLSLEQQVRVSLGWDCASVVSPRDGRSSSDRLSNDTQQQLEAFLRTTNRFDIALYFEGVSLAERSSKATLALGGPGERDSSRSASPSANNLCLKVRSAGRLLRFKQVLDCDWFRSRAVDNVASIVVVSSGEFHKLELWLGYVEKLDLASYVSIVCLDKTLQERLAEMGQPCHLLELEKPRGMKRYSEKSGRFSESELASSVRHFVAYVLSTYGLDVFYSDVDAYWMQNPVPYLASMAKDATGPAVVTSRDHRPYRLNKAWGSTFCTGVMFWYGRWPKELWANYLSNVIQDGNDQELFNELFYDIGVVWPTSLSHLGDDLVYGDVRMFNLTVALLPHSTFPRNCSAIDDRGQQTDVVMMHCK